MTCFIGAIIVVGIAFGGALAYAKIVWLERAIRGEDQRTPTDEKSGF